MAFEVDCAPLSSAETKTCATACDDTDVLVITDAALLNLIRAEQLCGSRCTTSRQYAIVPIRSCARQRRESPRVCSMPYLVVRGIAAIRACVAVCERLYPSIWNSSDPERGNAPRWFFSGEKYAVVAYADTDIKDTDTMPSPDPTVTCCVCLDAAASTSACALSYTT
jgi:hypothetical protein